MERLKELRIVFNNERHQNWIQVLKVGCFHEICQKAIQRFAGRCHVQEAKFLKQVQALVKCVVWPDFG